jgi:hypothetical protein
MTHDWTHDVKKYVPSPDEGAVKGIVKHCGIALHSRDASYPGSPSTISLPRSSESSPISIRA